MKKVIKLLSSGFVVFVCHCAVAQGVPYVGAVVGYTDNIGKLKTTEVEGSNPAVTSTGKVGSDGMNSGLFAGYAFQFKNGASLGAEVNGMLYGFRYKAMTTEGDSAYAKIENTYGIDFVPAYNLHDQVKLFLLLGYQRGNFKFKNTDSDEIDKDYSVKKGANGFDVGLGTDILLNDHFSLRFAYKYIRFETLNANDEADLKESAKINFGQFNLGIIYKFA